MTKIQPNMTGKTLFLFLTLVLISFNPLCNAKNKIKPSVAFSFDDGNSEDILDYKGLVWNDMIVSQLKKHKIQSVWFVCGLNMDDEKGKLLLKRWDESGNIIANHSYNHDSYGDSSMTFTCYVKDIQRCDSLIKEYRNYQKIFRFPYLAVGNTVEKRDSINNYFLENEIKQGWITIDTYDWYINFRLINQLKMNPKSDLKVYRDYYVNHTFEEAKYYNELSFLINHRQINHTLLLHFNLTTALFLGDLIKKFKSEGWKIINYSTAINDSIYNTSYKLLAFGQNLILAMANRNGTNSNELRFIAENVGNEKSKIDRLGSLNQTFQNSNGKNHLRK